MNENELFKTTLVGGFDKDDVTEQFQKLKDEAATKQTKLRKEIEEKEAQNAELLKRLELKDAHQARLEAEITEKYQKYIDNYDSIGRLVFDSQIRADAMIKDAKVKSEEIIAKAEQEASRRVESVQSEVDDKLTEGKKKYIAVQDEMNEIVELINQAQKRFMASYKEVHQIISTMPTSLRDIEGENETVLPEATREEKEIHLGDTQELDVIDSIEGMADLDEYDNDDDEVNENLVNKIHSLLDEDLEEDLQDEQ